MKITPVTGTTTIANGAATGATPEKLARLRAIAAGETPQEQQVAAQVKEAPQQNRIKMRTNQTVHRTPPQAVSEPSEGEKPTDGTAPPVISDVSNGAPAVPEVNVGSEVTQPLNPQQAALARQRRALQIKEQQIAEREKAIQSKLDLEARIKATPLKVMQELGVTYDQLTQEILANQQDAPSEIDQLKAEIKSLKEGVDKTLSDKDAQAEKAVLGQMRQTVNQLCAQGDDYELIRETQSQADVVDLIHRTWKETGEVMDELEAMQWVEKDLAEQALKIAKTKKVQAQLTPPAPLQQQPAQQTGIRTLTNKDSAKPVMGRKERAIAAMLGTLKR